MIKGREWEGILLINASGDLSVDHLVAGDESVVAFEYFVLHEGVDAVSLAPLFSVLDASFKSIGQCAVVGQMALVEGVEQGINYGFHINCMVGCKREGVGGVGGYRRARSAVSASFSSSSVR